MMFDLYVDNISLCKIQTKHNEQILMFQNKGNDETVAINVSNAELLNIFQQVKMRCENLDLITIAAPVKHGHWIFGEFDGIGNSVACSVCGFGAKTVDPNMWLNYPSHRYCGTSPRLRLCRA